MGSGQNVHIYDNLSPWLSFVCHDVEYESVGFVHAAAADGGEVVNTAVHVVVDDAFGGGDVFVLYGEHGAHDGRSDAGGELECARWFCSVADHAGEVGDHVLDAVGDLLVVAAHEIGDAYAAAS